MMKLQTYAVLSFFAASTVIYHAFHSRVQFYPALAHLSTSKISLVLLMNMGLVVMCILWKLTKKLFLGQLREAEVERLNEQSWREVMEILFAITIFRQTFSVTFLAMVTSLLLIKALHWLAHKRVEYIETTPSVRKLSHIRIVSFMGFLLVVDNIFLHSSVKYLIETREASVSLLFAFEYMILATTTISTFVKYIIYVSDTLMEGQWEKKAVYTFYLELIRDLLHLTLYMCFFLVIFVNYGVPLHLIRELYETFRRFKLRVADFIRYRKITSNMNHRFPDATPEELDVSDATCIICREEMTTAKKLLCGHLFHIQCLRSWLERQNTCPTCRAVVVPASNVTSTAVLRDDSPQQGTNTEGSTSSQSFVGAGVTNNVSLHQARLQAAASAASIYEKSFVYPSQNHLMCSPGLPQTFSCLQNAGMTDDSGAGIGLSEQSLYPNFDQLPQCFPPQFPGVDSQRGVGIAPDSQLDLQRKLIEHQIEILRLQLQLLKASKVKYSPDSVKSDIKGKSISSSSSSALSLYGSQE